MESKWHVEKSVDFLAGAPFPESSVHQSEATEGELPPRRVNPRWPLGASCCHWDRELSSLEEDV